MTKRISNAVIMAAGRGQRMMPVSEYIPKAMVPYAQSTLIARGIKKLRPHIASVHVTVGYKGAMLAAHLIEHGVRTIINSDGQTNSWWIGHTLLSRLAEPVFVLTCDNVTDIDFAELEDDYFSLGSPPCLLVPVEPVEGLEGDFIIHEKQVVSKLSREPESAVYASGIQVLNPSVVAACTETERGFNIVWRELIKNRQLLVSRIQPKKWYSVDTIDHLQQAVEKFKGE